MAGIEQRAVRFDSLAFSQGGIELSFVQSHNEGQNFVRGETLAVAVEALPDQVVEELLDALDELLEAMERAVHPTPDTKAPFQRPGR